MHNLTLSNDFLRIHEFAHLTETEINLQAGYVFPFFEVIFTEEFLRNLFQGIWLKSTKMKHVNKSNSHSFIKVYS